MNQSAIIIGEHRLLLTRVWNENKPLVLFVGLNPSTANANKNDPTVKRLMAITYYNDYGGFHLVNLFTFITAYPYELKYRFEKIGENGIIHSRCEDFYQQALLESECTIAMWGNLVPKELEHRIDFAEKRFENLLCMDINKSGNPKHGLYIKTETKFKKYD